MDRRIKKKYTIYASIENTWRALTHPSEINQWGAGPAEMDDKKGTRFKLWGGEIHGKNIEVAKPHKLVQEWYSGEWKEPSIATFELAKNDDKTELTLLHVNVPSKAVQDIDHGWDDYYLGPLKEYLEEKK